MSKEENRKKLKKVRLSQLGRDPDLVKAGVWVKYQMFPDAEPILLQVQAPTIENQELFSDKIEEIKEEMLDLKHAELLAEAKLAGNEVDAVMVPDFTDAENLKAVFMAMAECVVTDIGNVDGEVTKEDIYEFLAENADARDLVNKTRNDKLTWRKPYVSEIEGKFVTGAGNSKS